MNKFILAFLFISLSILGCKEKKKLNIPTTETSFFDINPNGVSYDTLQGIFYFENYIESYMDIDAITKINGFIHGDEINEKSYKNGYYIMLGTDYFKRLEHEDIFINYNSKSISSFQDSLFYAGMRTETYQTITNINPFCHSYYKKFFFEIEVIFLDTLLQKTPLFMNCPDYQEYIQENNGRNYKLDFLPTYLITEVFLWKEL